MRLPKHCKRRGNVIWWQRHWPKDVAEALGQKVAQASLKTGDPKLAEARRMDYEADFERTVRKIRGDLADQWSPRSIYNETLEALRRSDPIGVEVGLDDLLDAEAKRQGVGDPSEINPEDIPPQTQAQLDAYSSALRPKKRKTPKAYLEPFSQTAERYREYRQGSMSDIAMSQSKRTYGLFADFSKDAPLSFVTRKQVTGFLDAVARLNKSWGKRPQAASMSLNELLEVASVNSEDRLSAKTLKRYMSELAPVWDWAKERGEVEGENPFKGRTLGGNRRGKPKETANRPWASEEIEAVLEALGDDPGTKGNPNPLYWFPRIALCSGMRLGEIAALEVRDIKEAEGVTYFDIPKGKAEGSIRVVPVHSALKPLLDLAPSDGYLFPFLNPRRDGNRSPMIGKKLLNRFKKVDGALTFHGTRKTVVEAFERLRVPETETQQIVGHKQRGLTYGVYSPNGLTIKQKQELVERLELI